VEGDAAALGKTAGKDAASDKPTYTSLFGLDGAKDLAAACASRAHAVLVDGELTDSWLDAIADVGDSRDATEAGATFPAWANPRSRLDVLMVERGLVPSRERARAVILAGQVRVDGQVVFQGWYAGAAHRSRRADQPDHPYVGRGGLKLAHALDTFGIAVENRRALDIGASTGGFPTCCSSAEHAMSSRSTSGTISSTGSSEATTGHRPRRRERAHSQQETDVPHAVDIVTIDVAFISL
jgi:hypothetical protein